MEAAKVYFFRATFMYACLSYCGGSAGTQSDANRPSNKLPRLGLLGGSPGNGIWPSLLRRILSTKLATFPPSLQPRNASAKVPREGSVPRERPAISRRLGRAAVQM